MGIVVLTTIVNLDDVASAVMAISLMSCIVHVDDGHRRTRTRRHQPAWSGTRSRPQVPSLGFRLIAKATGTGTLKALRDAGGWFTVRSTYAHRFVFSGPTRRRRRLRDVVRKAALRGTIKLNLRDRPNRKARVALVQVRTAAVIIDTTEAFSEERMELSVNVVEVREIGTTPSGEEPLHWRLLTNHPVVTARDIDAILEGYAHRWKIEELHRVWKSGACRVEQSQLRSSERVIKWAILAVVAVAVILWAFVTIYRCWREPVEHRLEGGATRTARVASFDLSPTNRRDIHRP